MGSDNIKITILEDGLAKVETDKIGPANHVNADKLLAFLREKLGGEVKTEKRAEGHHHHVTTEAAKATE